MSEHAHSGEDELCVVNVHLQEQQIQKLKNEKLKIAMMKLKEASVQKVCTCV